MKGFFGQLLALALLTIGAAHEGFNLNVSGLNLRFEGLTQQAGSTPGSNRPQNVSIVDIIQAQGLRLKKGRCSHERAQKRHERPIAV